MPGLTWNHTEDIALSLYEAHPDLDPTHIRYTDLHKWITELPDLESIRFRGVRQRGTVSYCPIAGIVLTAGYL
jgi:FeS assembly protein IscX